MHVVFRQCDPDLMLRQSWQRVCFPKGVAQRIVSQNIGCRCIKHVIREQIGSDQITKEMRSLRDHTCLGCTPIEGTDTHDLSRKCLKLDSSVVALRNIFQVRKIRGNEEGQISVFAQAWRERVTFTNEDRGLILLLSGIVDSQ